MTESSTLHLQEIQQPDRLSDPDPHKYDSITKATNKEDVECGRRCVRGHWTLRFSSAFCVCNFWQSCPKLRQRTFGR